MSQGPSSPQHLMISPHGSGDGASRHLDPAIKNVKFVEGANGDSE